MPRGVCEVHRLVQHDATVREVHYCSCCSAYICDNCMHSTDRIVAFYRAKGNASTKLSKFFKCMGMAPPAWLSRFRG